MNQKVENHSEKMEMGSGGSVHGPGTSHLGYLLSKSFQEQYQTSVEFQIHIKWILSQVLKVIH